MRKHIVRRLLGIVLIALACLVVLLPLLRPGFPVTDDGNWMIIRLSAFYQSFRDGQFPVRFLGRLNYSYGYPVADFLYPGFLYLGSFMHIFGLNFQNVVKVIMGGSVVIGAVALYFWLRHFFDEVASALGAASFLLMPYVFYDLYTRGSTGELLAMGVCMVALWAIEGGYRWALPPVIALLVISHNTLALFFIAALFVYILLKRSWGLIGPFLMGVLMAAFFWLPAIRDQRFVIFNGVAVSDPAQYFKAGQNLLLAGIPYLVACILAFFLGNRAYRKQRAYFSVILIVSGLLATQVTGFIWHFLPFVRLVQFPYRFFALWIFTGPWLVADVADSQNHVWHWILGLVVVVGLYGATIPYQKAQNIIRPEGYFTTNESTTTVANEYMPKWITQYPTQRTPERLEVDKGNATIEEHRITTNTIDVVVHAKEESTVQINTVYYPGWGAMVDNKPVKIYHDNPFGLMRLTIPSGDHTVYMAFRETAGRFIADTVSFIACVLYVLIYIIFEIVHRKQSGGKRKKSKK